VLRVRPSAGVAAEAGEHDDGGEGSGAVRLMQNAPRNYRAIVEAGRRYGVYPLDPKMVEEYRQENYIARYGDKSARVAAIAEAVAPAALEVGVVGGRPPIRTGTMLARPTPSE